MADSKITALTSIGASTDPANDPLVLVDVSDTSITATGTTKKVTLNQLLGASGTATLASATITGDLTVRTTGLILNANGLGVGIAPTSFGAGYGTIQVSGATGSGIRMGSPTNGSFIYSDNTWLNILTETNVPHRHFVNNQVQYTVQHPGIFTWLDGAGGTRMTLNSTGLGVGVTPSAGRGAIQLSAGVGFPATQVASSDANTLDDYEEGTWTGTLKGSVSDPTTPVTATGRYTKIGRQVSVQISFVNVDTTGASGDITVTGVPFANNGSIVTTGSMQAAVGVTFTGTLASLIDVNGTTLIVSVTASNAARLNGTHNAGTSRFFWLEITYTV